MAADSTIHGLGQLTGASVDQSADELPIWDNSASIAKRITIAEFLTGRTHTGLLTLTGVANTGVLASTGYSLTGSNAASMIDLAGTWNTSGNATAIKLNLTDTASGSSSKLLDLQVGGSSMFHVTKAGAIQLASNILTLGSLSSFGQTIANNEDTWRIALNSGVWLRSADMLRFSDSSSANGGTKDTAIGRNASGVVEINNGTLGTYRDLIARKVTANVSVNPPAALSDGANIATDASLGNIFTVTIAADRTLDAPTNPTSGQVCTWVIKASGADRTLTLASGAGAFRFGATITAVTATTSAKTDYITAVYNSADSRWDVTGYAKGF